jgi:hypothetical protein
MHMRRIAQAAVAAAGPCGDGRHAPPAAAGTKLIEPLNQYVVERQGQSRGPRPQGFDLTEAWVKGKAGFVIVATPRRPPPRRQGRDGAPARPRGATAAVAAPSPLTDPTHGYDVFRPGA